MTRLLFLGFRHSSPAVMAAAFARAQGVEDLEVVAAAFQPAPVHPLAVRAMAEAGLQIGDGRIETFGDLGGREFDVVVTLCREAAGACPLLPGQAEPVHWNLPVPESVEGDEAVRLAAFRRCRDDVRRLAADLFERGYFDALRRARGCAGIILSNISDGILAHDMRRRVFCFNQAAERITGYRREEVINRDCRDIFPGGFCGGKCLFEGKAVPEFDVRRREVEFATAGGERRRLDTVVKSLTDARGERVGVLVSFRDTTRERDLARRVGEIQQFSGIIGRDAKMLEIFDLVRELAESTAPVLIQGESGTGKELVAAAIHNEGPRANRLFVPVNCGALPESLLESELFGHVKGAFTGAIRDKKGRFELADGGSIFLDEIGDIAPAVQVRLLRVLQEGRFERVGGEETLQVDVRVISATNKDLSEEIRSGRFRDDLYYRLSVVPIWLPPLRERRNDIPLLVAHVLRRIAADAGREGMAVSSDAMDVMLSYDWPGNVRELQNWIQFALVKCRDSIIRPEHLPPLRPGVPATARGPRRRKLDADTVRMALRRTGGNKVEAARMLGVSRATLYRFLDATDVTP